MLQTSQIIYAKTKKPHMQLITVPLDLPDSVYQLRFVALQNAMKIHSLDVMLVYADREHAGNFDWLTGFEPRFEEACLIIHSCGKVYLMLGNECLKMHKYSRLSAIPVHTPVFSLPNQPTGAGKSLSSSFVEAGVLAGQTVGVAGWKLFQTLPSKQKMFDVPHFIVEDLCRAVGPEGYCKNATDLFIHPGYGLRVRASAEAIACYEYQSTLASQSVWAAMEDLEVGRGEKELANHLNRFGQPLSCYSMCATGERFTNAVVYPRENRIMLGDRFTVSMGLKGGLTCRVGYAAYTEADLPCNARDYVERVAKPYFAASVIWYESLQIGMTGGELYKRIQDVLPNHQYSWTLNPGHLIASEEWLSSPIYPDSPIPLVSGMMMQMDIIVHLANYGGCNAEDGVVLADEALREEIKGYNSALYARMMSRKAYIRNELGINLPPEVLPMSDTVGYLRPLLLNKEWALRVQR